jgi:SlyX protein
MNDETTELRLAFLERANQELSDVVYRQQRQIDALTGTLAELTGRLESLKDQEEPRPAAEERPPHY